MPEKSPEVLPNISDVSTPIGEGGAEQANDAPGRPPIDEAPGGEPIITDIGGDIGSSGGGADMGEVGTPPIPKTPEEELLDRSKLRLEKDVKDILDDLALKKESSTSSDMMEKVVSRLLDLGWKVTRLKELLPNKQQGGIEKYIKEIISKPDVEQNQDVNTSTGVNLKTSDSRGFLMSKKFNIEDGTLVEASVPDVKPVLDNLSKAIRTVKASVKNYVDIKVRLAGVATLKKTADEDSALLEKGGFGGFGSDMDISGNPLSDALSKIEEALSALRDAIQGGASLENDMSLDRDDASELGDLMDDGKELGEETQDFVADEKSEDKDEDEEKEEEKEKEEPKIEEKDASSKTEEVKKEGSEETDKKDSEAMEDKEDKKEKTSSEIFLDKVRSKLAELRLKEAKEKGQAGYPFDDRNKQNVDAQPVPNIELGPEAPKDKLSDRLRGPENKAENLKAKEGMIDIESAERLRQSSIENTQDKARLAVELTSRQQLKGLLDNPLREALIKGFTEYGVAEEEAKAIVHNAYVDAYEDSQKIIMKEAFDTFMEKPIEEYIKISEFVDNYQVKTSNVQPPVEETKEELTTKEANVTAPLNGTPADKDNGDMYKGYWQDAKKRRQSGLI